MADQQFRAPSSCLVIAFLMVIVTAQKNGPEEHCLSPLGMEDGRIKDDQLTATTSLNGLSQAANGRLNHKDGLGGWCPNRPLDGNRVGPYAFDDRYIQVKLNMPVRLKGIATQGRYNGVEKVERYWIAYTPDIKNVRHKWIYDEPNINVKIFEGNINRTLHSNILKPPIVVEQIRIYPEVHKRKQVCLRFELFGCSLKYGLVTYTMPQGNTREGRYNFTDSGYDGLITESHVLYAGLGMLTDGKLAPENYFDTYGLGWIGWNAKDTPKPYMIFKFLKTRIFRAMTLHCNVRDTAKIKLFSKVKIRFSIDGVYSSKSILYKPKNISSGSSWMNYNVTIDLHQRTGKLMTLDFSYTGHWILISEVTFQQDINCQGICLVHNPVQTDLTLLANTTRSTKQRQQNISTASGLTFMEIALNSVVGSVIFIVVAVLAGKLFKKHRAGRKEMSPYATVRYSEIFPPNATNNSPGNFDIPVETLSFLPKTPPEEGAAGRTELQGPLYENIDHHGGPSVTPVNYLIYQPRYENETVNRENSNLVIRPGYDKLTPTTSQPREYDSLIRETNITCKSRRGDIADTEREDNMNIHTILEVPSSDERTPACSMDKKKNQENSQGKIKSECIENVWKKETLI